MGSDDDATSPLATRARPDDTASSGPAESSDTPSGPPRPNQRVPRTSSVRVPGAPPPAATGAARPSADAPPTPMRRQALLVRLLLVLLVVGVGSSIVLVAARDAHVTGAPPGLADQDVPALQVNPAPIQLGTVGQPVGNGLPDGSLLPNAAVPGPNAAGRPSAPGPTSDATLTGPAGGSLASLAAWARRLSVTTSIPARALQAYGLADLAMRKLAPTCHLSWVTVAGLARIESNHGRFRGSSVGADGEVTPPIIGVPLDGTNGNTTITDGSGAYAAAMGPLQFIPSTWQRWGVDTHGTGRADANNIDDAAVTAGRYLCAAGGDLATGPGWRNAVLAYNASDDYARRVYAAADAYAHGQSA